MSFLTPLMEISNRRCILANALISHTPKSDLTLVGLLCNYSSPGWVDAGAFH